jgi:hypothetical protein
MNLLEKEGRKDKELAYPLIIGLGLLAFLVILSFVYWQERVFYADAAFQIFSVIDTAQFAFQVQRFGAVIVQFPPLMLVKLNAPLDLVLKVYSLTFTIYPLLFALMIWKWLDESRLALLVVLFLGLTQVHTFFWIQSELIQGCMYSILGIAIIKKQLKPDWWLLLIWQLLVVFVIYSHPLSVALFLFLWAWYAYECRKEIDWRYYSLLVTIILVLIYKFKIAALGTYDANAVGMFAGFEERLPNLFSLPSTVFFFKRILSTYYLLPLILALNLVFLFRQKAWWNITLMLSGVIVWLLLILTTYHYSTDQMYLESYYLPLGIFIGLPFVDKVFGIGKAWVWITFMIVVSCFRVGQIIGIQDKYGDRLAWLKEQVAKAEEIPYRRFYLLRSQTNPHQSNLDWATSYETMLISSIKSPSNTHSIYIIPSEDQIEAVINREGGIPSPLGFHSFKSLNTNYFNVPEEKGPIRNLYDGK